MGELAKLLRMGNNRLYKLLLILLVGICFVIIVWPEADSGDGDKDAGAAVPGGGTTTEEGKSDSAYGGDFQYVEYMEKRLTAVLEGMTGISQVSVMITVKDNGERQTIKDVSSSGSSEDGSSQSSTSEETVMRDTDSGTEPYVTRYMEPAAEGVVICCNGADNADTVLKITDAVQALFDVPAHKIVILEAN